jgi:hypothetical protein
MRVGDIPQEVTLKTTTPGGGRSTRVLVLEPGDELRSTDRGGLVITHRKVVEYQEMMRAGLQTAAVMYADGRIGLTGFERACAEYRKAMAVVADEVIQPDA